jgi:hypothetical protein
MVKTSAAAHRAIGRRHAVFATAVHTNRELPSYQTPGKDDNENMKREMRTGALGLGDDSLAQLTGREGGRRLDVVPLLLGERVNTAAR